MEKGIRNADVEYVKEGEKRGGGGGTHMQTKLGFSWQAMYGQGRATHSSDFA